MLAGGYPVAPFVAAAEDDPTVTFPPGAGPAGHAAARQPRRRSGRLRGLARSGHLRRRQSLRRRRRPRPHDGVHRRPTTFTSCTSIAPSMTADAAAPGQRRCPAQRAGGGESGGLLAVVALGGTRTGNRHSQPGPRRAAGAGGRRRGRRRGPARRAGDRHQPRRHDDRRSAKPTSTARARPATCRSSSSAPACAPASSPASRPRPPICRRRSCTRWARRRPPTSRRGPGRRAPPSAASRSRPPLPRPQGQVLLRAFLD